MNTKADKIKHAKKRLEQFRAAYKAVEDGPEMQEDTSGMGFFAVSRKEAMRDKAVCVRHAEKVLERLVEGE